MKLFIVSRKRPDWCEDYAIVVVAKDELHAERCARVNSGSFEKELKSNITIEEIKMDYEKCVLKANTGS